MNKLILLDEGDFSFEDEIDKPLGGAQSAFIGLVKGLSSIGCYLEVRNNCDREFFSKFINWKKLDYNEKLDGDGYIVNRNTRLLNLVCKNKPVLFWLHNRGNYLLRFKNIKYLFKFYPTLVFSGKYHRSTFYLWFFFKFKVIPYGLNDVFFQKKIEFSNPGPRAIFTSNPLRSLNWLVDRWIEIKKRVPNGELHIFSGPSPYGNWGSSMASKMQTVIQYAKDYSAFGIFVHEPVSKHELISEIQKSKVMLYKGDVAETFCLSIAESLELGVPCVTMNLGSMKERINSGKNGFVLKSDDEFVNYSVELLTNDFQWKQFHKRLTQANVNYSWIEIAKKFKSCF